MAPSERLVWHLSERQEEGAMKGGRAQNTLGIKKYNKRKGIKDVSEGPPLRKKAHKNLPPPPSGKERQRQNTLKCAFF